MSMNIYVGNLPYDSTEEEISQLFAEFGTVSSTNIIKDKTTGNSKGFGFVEMDDDTEGQKAIDELNGAALRGRNLKINLARPRTERPRAPRKTW